MALWHLLEEDEANQSMNVVFHIDVPPGNNSAGVPWARCVACCGRYSNATVLPECAHAAHVTNGTIIELAESFVFSAPDLNDAQKKAELQARYNVLQTETLAEIESRLDHYLYECD